MVLWTNEQLYFAPLWYYSKKFDEITVLSINIIIDSFKVNCQEDIFLIIQQCHKFGANMQWTQS